MRKLISVLLVFLMLFCTMNLTSFASTQTEPVYTIPTWVDSITQHANGAVKDFTAGVKFFKDSAASVVADGTNHVLCFGSGVTGWNTKYNLTAPRTTDFKLGFKVKLNSLDYRNSAGEETSELYQYTLGQLRIMNSDGANLAASNGIVNLIFYAYSNSDKSQFDSLKLYTKDPATGKLNQGTEIDITEFCNLTDSNGVVSMNNYVTIELLLNNTTGKVTILVDGNDMGSYGFMPDTNDAAEEYVQNSLSVNSIQIAKRNDATASNSVLYFDDISFYEPTYGETIVINKTATQGETITLPTSYTVGETTYSDISWEQASVTCNEFGVKSYVGKNADNSFKYVISTGESAVKVHDDIDEAIYDGTKTADGDGFTTTFYASTKADEIQPYEENGDIILTGKTKVDAITWVPDTAITGDYKLSIKMKTDVNVSPASTAEAFKLTVKNSDGTSLVRGYIQITKNVAAGSTGMIGFRRIYWNGSKETNDATYAFNNVTWDSNISTGDLTLDILWNNANKTYDLYLNGTSVGTGISHYLGNVENTLSNFGFASLTLEKRSAIDTTTYIKDIKVSQNRYFESFENDDLLIGEDSSVNTIKANLTDGSYKNIAITGTVNTASIGNKTASVLPAGFNEKVNLSYKVGNYDVTELIYKDSSSAVVSGAVAGGTLATVKLNQYGIAGKYASPVLFAAYYDGGEMKAVKEATIPQTDADGNVTLEINLPIETVSATSGVKLFIFDSIGTIRPIDMAYQ